MNELKINGTKEFMGISIPIIEGGFGENAKCVLAKTIADIHGTRQNDVQDLIINNIDEFEENIDIIDLCDERFKTDAIGLGFITSNRQKHCYLLSEQGYIALVSLMRTNKAKEIRKQFRREYFSMREIISSNEQIKAKLLLSIYDGGQEAILASKQLTDLEVTTATAPLLETIEEQKPKAEFHDAVHTSTNSISVGKFSAILQKNTELKRFGRNTLFQWFRDNEYLCKCGNTKNKPTQKSLSAEYMDYVENVNEDKYGKFHTSFTPYVTGKGQTYFTKKLLKEFS